MASSGQDPAEEWDWLSRRLVETLHAESLSRFGGTPRLRDEGLLESALAGLKHRARYEHPSVHELAATYCEGLLQNTIPLPTETSGRACSRPGRFCSGTATGWSRRRQKRSR